MIYYIIDETYAHESVSDLIDFLTLDAAQERLKQSHLFHPEWKIFKITIEEVPSAPK